MNIGRSFSKEIALAIKCRNAGSRDSTGSNRDEGAVGTSEPLYGRDCAIIFGCPFRLTNETFPAGSVICLTWALWR